MAAIDEGIGGAFSYPGTPATEILETVQDAAPDIWAHWSANEKVAYEEALGMSYAGRRALVSMKHVGLNVAADPFMSSSLTGANGGLVLVVADDPGMHSSQNEQDSRFYADFARIPCLEPSNQQECYDFTRRAFELSERLKLPVMIRLVTRIAHSRAVVRRSPASTPAVLPKPDSDDWTLIPAHARVRFRHLLDLQSEIQAVSEGWPANEMRLTGPRGVMCTGTGYNYVREALGDDSSVSLLRLSMYPLPVETIRRFVAHCSDVLIFEEGYPFIERQLKGLLGLPGTTIRGKLDATLPPDGELNPSLAAQALGIPLPAPAAPMPVPGRPPQFCKGCPHSSTFHALIEATAEFESPMLFSDIGCYAMGMMPPFEAVHSCVDMGASIGMAHGASRAGAHPVICTIGDSTFAHSGMTPLLGAVLSDANMTVMVMDNATTAMTGAQESMATGEQLLEILRGLGVKHLQLFEPLPKHHAANVEAVRAAIAHQGLSVIVARRACIQIKPRKAAQQIPVQQEQTHAT
jgi:indolepyruvate ferredoxin oxidoreductase alpha subunit